MVDSPATGVGVKKRPDFLLVTTVVAIATVSVTFLVRSRAPQPSAPPPRPPVSMEVMADIQSCATFLQEALAANAESADASGAVATLEPEDPSVLVDLWGRPYVVNSGEDEGRPTLFVITLGADGLPGGAEAAQDVWLSLEPQEGEE